MLPNKDIETFYYEIRSSIKVLAAYKNNKTYKQMIRSCRLKPIDVYDPKFKITKQLFPKWVDEYGNSWDAVKDKIILGDTSLPFLSKQSTDLFFGISPNELVAKSIRGLFIGNSVPEIIAFYGKDEYIRCVRVAFNEIERISPLVVGTEAICKLISEDLTLMKKIDKDILPKEISNKYDKVVIARIRDDIKIEEILNG